MVMSIMGMMHCFISVALYGEQKAEGNIKKLIEGFKNPSATSRPYVFWDWFDGVLTKKRIQNDLEQMKSQGVGGALISEFTLEHLLPQKGPVFMSDGWLEYYKYAIEEADRLGLKIYANLCSGWEAGGTWITPDLGQQRYVFSLTNAIGSRIFKNKLPLPALAVNDKYYKDSLVVAYKIINEIPVTRMNRDLVKVSAFSSQEGLTPKNLIDNNPATAWKIKITPENEKEYEDVWIQFEFNKAFEADKILLQFIFSQAWNGYLPKWKLQKSDDGITFTDILEEKKHSEITSFSTQKTKFYRVFFTHVFIKTLPSIGEIQFLKEDEKSNIIHEFAQNTEGQPEIHLDLSKDHRPAQISSKDYIDLTDKTKSDGSLKWNVPEGKWVIIRFGHIPSYTTTFRAKTGKSLESDFMSKKAVKHHFDHTGKILAEIAGPLCGKTLQSFWTDSWENNHFNWTPKMPELFKKYSGYSIMPYLAILCGYVVDSKEETNRFLYDFKKTIGNSLADIYFGVLTEESKKYGIGNTAEGIYHNCYGGENLKCYGRLTGAASEFWVNHNSFKVNCGRTKFSASANHVYGNKLVPTEAFTSRAHWREFPLQLKVAGDQGFCNGLNDIVLHGFAHSPEKFGIPGLTYGAGTHFNQNVTWWNQIKPLNDYWGRCQYLLRQGLFVADICSYGQMTSTEYETDICNGEVILTRMSVKDGKIILPDGMSYSVLSLPEDNKMPLKVLKKIGLLLDKGGIIAGSKPTGVNGLNDYLNSMEEFHKLADYLWKKYSKQIFSSTATALASLNIPVDFKCDNENILHYHRRTEDIDIYFISNFSSEWTVCVPEFRVNAKSPELWCPRTGNIRRNIPYTSKNKMTTVKLKLPPYGSTFVIFKPSNNDNIISAVRSINSDDPEFYPEVFADESNQNYLLASTNGKYQIEYKNGEKVEKEIKDIPSALKIKGPWKIIFPPNLGAPESIIFDKLISWITHSDEGIKYFSGTGSYFKEFNVPNNFIKKGNLLFLDLGDVKYVAEVILNGKNAGIAWTTPFRLNITDVVKLGNNQLEIKVINNWCNRIIGDHDLPKDKRITQAVMASKSVIKHRDLMDSGLLGPVKILVQKKEKFDN